MNHNDISLLTGIGLGPLIKLESVLALNKGGGFPAVLMLVLLLLMLLLLLLLLFLLLLTARTSGCPGAS